MNNSTTPQKRCTLCKEVFPATTEYFVRNKSCKDGLHTRCKKCKYAQGRDRWANNADDINARRRESYPEHRERNINYHRDWRIRNRDKIRAKKKADYWADPEADKAKSRAYRQAHPEARRAYDREYSKTHRRSIRMRQKEWEDLNRPHINEKRRKQYAEDPHSRRLSALKREARKRNLPADFTNEDWQLCLSHFTGCAVCGALEFLQGDHWIPLASPDCTGTVPSNMVPLCRSCNFSKQDTPAIDWLKWKYGDDVGGRINDRIVDFITKVVRKID